MPRSQRGVTLVELMVSMVLGLLLIFAATTLYEITKRTTRAQEATARLMENGRAATEILNRSIRMARYFGCAGVDSFEVINHFDDSNADETPDTLNGYDQQGIFGIHNNDAGTPDEITILRALDNPELEPRALEADLTLDSTGTAPDSAIILDIIANNPAGGDMIAITDCLQADVFNTTGRSVVSGQHHYTYTSCPTCSRDYLLDAVVLRVAKERFYIARSERGDDLGDDNLTALFVADPNDPSTRVELIEGVENMKILYGLDTNGDGVANQYVLPGDIRDECEAAASGTGGNACWRRVTSVRISLLLATVENTITTSPQQYTFNGTDYTASDRRLRREFLTIIALRNYRP